MTSVRFLFIGEGSSDDELVTHLERCCILAGADEAEGIAPDFLRIVPVGRTVDAKLETALQYEPNIDFAFVHRDADFRDPEPRYNEINQAVEEISVELQHVAVVPIQTIEAWLILDEIEIRRVAENPSGRVPLNIPRPGAVENIADPKTHLEDAILEASEQSGRRRQRTKRKVQQKKRLLLQRLNPEGFVCQTPAWQRMFSDLKNLLDRLSN